MRLEYDGNQSYIELNLGKMKIRTDWEEILTYAVVGVVLTALILFLFLYWRHIQYLSNNTELTNINTELIPLHNAYYGYGVDIISFRFL